MVLWAIELSEFEVQYGPRITIKAQPLVDFFAKFIAKEDKGKGAAPWMVQTNESFNLHAEGNGVFLRSPKGDLIECTVCLQFLTTNNEAKYKVVLTSLDLVKAVGALSAITYSDSQVIVWHVNGYYEA